jgi:hypothetical protein
MIQIARGLLLVVLLGLAVPGNSATPEPPSKKEASKSDKLWRLWAVLDSEEDAAFFAAAFSPDNTLLAGGQGNGVVRLWETASAKQRPVLQGRHKGPILALMFAADGKTLVAASTDAVSVWDVEKENTTASFRWGKLSVLSVAVAGNGQLVACGTAEGTVRLWSTTGKELLNLKGPKKGVFALAFAPDSKLLAAGFADGSVRLWEMPSGKESVALKGKAQGMVRTLAFSPQGSKLASVGGREGVTLWDLKTGAKSTGFKAGAQLYYSVAFSADGKLVAAGSPGGTLQFWNASSGKEQSASKGHAGAIWVTAFARDGVTLATASVDSTIRVWEQGKRLKVSEVKLTAEELKQFLTELQNENESRGTRAVLALAAVPKQTLPLLRKGLPQGSRPNDKLLARLVADLDDNRYAVRQKASTELEKGGPAARQALRTALSGKPTLEVRKRIEVILAKMESQLSPSNRLFNRRAFLVLERMDHPEARQVLEAFLWGTLDDELHDEAKAALQRMPE